MTHITRVRRRKGDAVLTIPADLLSQLGIRPGTDLSLVVIDGTLVAAPARLCRRYSIDELLEGSEEMISLSASARGWDAITSVGAEIV